MDNDVFEEYFDKTYYQEGKPYPSYDAFKSMEDAFIQALMNLKSSGKFQEYKYCFSFYGKRVIERNGFCLRMTDEGKDIHELKLYHHSLERLREGLKSLDKSLYMKEIYPSVAKGKKMRRRRLLQKANDSSTFPKTTSVVEKKEIPDNILVPHFESLNITVEQAENLYGRLVQGGFLEDTGKDDFVYYYTGKGYQAKRQLRWKGNYIALSFLMRRLYPESMRISWKTLQQVYAEVDEKKANTMKNVLSKTMGGNGVYTKDSYEKMVDEWLK